jgi:hypothetical protein
MRYGLLVVLLVVTAAAGAAAQSELLQAGQRIRVTSPEFELDDVEATIVRVYGDTVVLRSTGSRVDSTVTTIPLSRLTKLEVRVGQRSNIDKGIRTGVLVGGGVGLLVGAASAASDNSYVCSGAGCVLQGTVGGALWGLLIGAAVGAFTHRDEWMEVRSSAWSDRVQVGIAPTRNGVGIGARIAF